MLHYGPRRPELETARLGLVVGKKFLKRAVQRNLIKRIVREQFRLKRPDIPCRDLVVRLVVRLEKVDRHAVKDEIVQLLGKLRPDNGSEKSEKTSL